jgi:hypothetical protein
LTHEHASISCSVKQRAGDLSQSNAGVDLGSEICYSINRHPTASQWSTCFDLVERGKVSIQPLRRTRRLQARYPRTTATQHTTPARSHFSSTCYCRSCQLNIYMYCRITPFCATLAHTTSIRREIHNNEQIESASTYAVRHRPTTL